MQSQQLRAWKLGFTTSYGFSRTESHHITHMMTVFNYPAFGFTPNH